MMHQPDLQSPTFRRRVAALAVVAMTLGTTACWSSSEPSSDTGSPGDTGAAADTADGADVPTPDAGDGTTASTRLVTNDAWERADASNDPWASHRPSSVDCPMEAVEIEELQGERTLSISTDRCNYLAVHQQTRAAIDSGDTLRIRVWHFKLTHDQSAEAHVALALDQTGIWDKRVPIPTESGGLVTKTWEASSDYPAGTRVDFHLHNHGTNAWNFIEFSNID